MLHIPLAEPLASGQELTIGVTFVLTLPHLNPLWWVPKGNFGWGERVTQVGDWHPALVPYERGKGWLTWNYVPVGDPTVNQVATYDVRLRTASQVTIAAPGFQERSGEVWSFHGERWRSFAFLASPEYQVVEAEAHNVRLRSFYLAGEEREGQIVLDTANQCLDLFGERYGPYPYPELIVAQNGYYGGMEYSGLVSMSGYAYEHYAGGATLCWYR